MNRDYGNSVNARKYWSRTSGLRKIPAVNLANFLVNFLGVSWRFPGKFRAAPEYRSLAESHKFRDKCPRIFESIICDNHIFVIAEKSHNKAKTAAHRIGSKERQSDFYFIPI